MYIIYIQTMLHSSNAIIGAFSVGPQAVMTSISSILTIFINLLFSSTSFLQLHMILSPIGHECSVSPETESVSSETTDGPHITKIPETTVTLQEDEEDLSDTDSESEWDTPVVTRV